MLKRILHALVSFIRPFMPAKRRSTRPPSSTPAPRPDSLPVIVPRTQIDLAQVSHLSRVASLAEFARDVLGYALRPGEQGPPARPPRLRGRWKRDTGHLAMICADMVELAPDLFPGLPFTKDGLCTLVSELKMLEQMVLLVRGLLKQLEGVLAARKDELCSSTEMIVETVEGLARTPLLSNELRERVGMVAGPIRQHLRERNGKVQKVRKHRRHLREQNEVTVAEAQEELDVVRVENHILRGGAAKDLIG